MYYIDAMESEMSLFDFPGLSPATESIGEKLGKALKFIARKVKEFVQKIIDIVKYILGNGGQYKANDIKNKAVADLKTRLKAYLPDKDVTDLTKIKGLSSYQGGESIPYISESEYDRAIQVFEQSMENVIKIYSDELTVYNNDINSMTTTLSKGSSEIHKYASDALRTIKNNSSDGISNFRIWITSLSNYDDKAKTYRDNIQKNAEAFKKKMNDQISVTVEKSNNFPEDIISLIKGLINTYIVKIKVAMRDGYRDLIKNVKFCESLANDLQKNADDFEKLADTYNSVNDMEWQRATSEAAKTNLSFSQTIFAVVSSIKNSSNEIIFDGVKIPQHPNVVKDRAAYEQHRKQHMEEFKKAQDEKSAKGREEYREYLKNHPDDYVNHIGEVAFRNIKTGKIIYVKSDDLKSFDKCMNDKNLELYL